MRVSARKLRNSAVLFIVLAFGMSAFAADVDGVWTAKVDGPEGEENYVYTLQADGNTLTGTAKSDESENAVQLTDGVINGNDISFSEKLDFDGEELVIKYKGKISGDRIEFDREVGTFTNDKVVAPRKK